MKKSWYLLALAVSLCDFGYLHGQKFTRENYFDYLPPLSHIIRQTAASASLFLYGNPLDKTYRDASPADGIDADFVDLTAAASLPGASNGEPVRNRNYAKCSSSAF